MPICESSLFAHLCPSGVITVIHLALFSTPRRSLPTQAAILPPQTKKKRKPCMNIKQALLALSAECRTSPHRRANSFTFRISTISSNCLFSPIKSAIPLLNLGFQKSTATLQKQLDNFVRECEGNICMEPCHIAATTVRKYVAA